MNHQKSGIIQLFQSETLRVALSVVLLSLLGLGIFYPRALTVFVLDAATTLLLIAPAMLAGLNLVPLFRLGNLPIRWRVILGAALGCGMLALLTLLLGVCGLLQRSVFVVLNVALLAVGVIGLRRCIVEARTIAEIQTSTDNHHRFVWLWLLVVPFLVLSSAAATTAPGFIWKEEGYGYDVLEYHLQIPKEYRQDGRVHFLPHNVYASFPSNMEMLYLHAMIMLDDDVDVGTVANCLHWMLGVLFVAAGWLIAREWSTRAGVVTGIVLGSTGWLSYLSGLAYVEHGVLFLGMLATGAVIRAISIQRGASTTADRKAKRVHVGGASLRSAHNTIGNAGSSRRWFALAGVLAGFSCGFKYTAVACVAVPLFVVVLISGGMRLGERIRNAMVFIAFTLLVFSPWLIRNIIDTGNPIFPLAHSVFASTPQGWGEEEAARWNEGHRAKGKEGEITNRVGQFWYRVLKDHEQRFGPVIFVLAAVGLMKGRWSRVELAFALVLGLQVLVWLFATHLYARFAVFFLIPLAMLAGRAITGVTHRGVAFCAASLLIGGTAWNAWFAHRLHRTEQLNLFAAMPPAVMYEGHVPGFEYYGRVNNQLPADAKMLLVGESRAFYFRRHVEYCTVFNRNPFVEVVSRSDSPQAVVDWLRSQSYTHVLIHWGEIERLRSSYGFSEQITTELLSNLENAGLSLVESFPYPTTAARYVDLYEVIGS